MWSIRRCTGFKSLSRDETLLQGRTSQRLQIFHKDGSVAVPQNFAASWPSIEQKMLGPYVGKRFKLLIKKRIYYVFFYSIYQYRDWVICTGLFVYIMQADSKDKPIL